MTKGEQRFNAVKDGYIKDFNRTNRKSLASLYYEGGYVHIVSPIGETTHHSKYKIGEFETMAATLSLRKTLRPLRPVAKLVYVTLVTRVIVDESDDEVAIMAKAKKGFQAKIDNDELVENILKIKKDKECPHGTFSSDSF